MTATIEGAIADMDEAVAARISVDASGCWLWTGARTTAGYGHLRYRGGFEYAHRLTYSALVGPIPDGLTIDHLCRVRHCCNPDHLEPVTQQENTRRAKAVLTTCPSGHAYDEANTYRSPRGERRCRTCARQRDRSGRNKGRATA